MFRSETDPSSYYSGLSNLGPCRGPNPSAVDLEPSNFHVWWIWAQVQRDLFTVLEQRICALTNWKTTRTSAPTVGSTQWSRTKEDEHHMHSSGCLKKKYSCWSSGIEGLYRSDEYRLTWLSCIGLRIIKLHVLIHVSCNLIKSHWDSVWSCRLVKVGHWD